MNTRLMGWVLGGSFLAAGAAGTSAKDWPQYRGPGVDSQTGETIPARAPKKVWSAKTENGFSSFVVAGGKAFTVVSRDVDGAPIAECVALDAKTGKELWHEPTGVAKFQRGGDSGADDNKGGDGPRSTPAISGDKVYVYSADMVLQCLAGKSGKVLWKHDIGKEFNGQNIGWKSAMSPVIEGDLVYVAGGGAGQAMLAFNKENGEIAWKTGEDKMTHATPVPATIHGARQIIFLMESGLVALEAKTGKPLWKFAFPFRTATACSPVVNDDVVFVTAGYGIGGAACRVSKNGEGFQATEIWRNRGDNAVASLWSTPVCKDGYLYGMISAKKFGTGPLKCVDLKTGEVKWEQGGFGAGNVVLAGDKLIALADNGEVVLAKASPDGYQELARTKALEGKCWSTPALSDGKLYVRSTKEGACLSFD